MAKRRDWEPATDRIAVSDDFALLKPRVSKTGYSLGYKKDPDDQRDLRARTLFGARRGIRQESMELVGCVPRIKDQGSTLSCVGQAIGTAIDARLRRLGRWDVPESSSQAIYTFARALERNPLLDFESKPPPLVDFGSHPRLAMKGMKDWGVPTESRWPFNPSRIDEELPWDVMQESSTHCVQAWWRIDSMGKERVEDVCQALMMGYPVVFGTVVDQAFMDFTGKGWVPVPDASRLVGGHMMCFVGYKSEDSQRVLKGVNSWGSEWGDDGFYWAGEAFVQDPNLGDIYVLQVN